LHRQVANIITRACNPIEHAGTAGRRRRAARIHPICYDLLIEGKSLPGHEKLEMINTYMKLAEQDNRELYARYSPVDALEMHRSPGGKREKMREWRNAHKKSSK